MEKCSKEFKDPPLFRSAHSDCHHFVQCLKGSVNVPNKEYFASVFPCSYTMNMNAVYEQSNIGKLIQNSITKSVIQTFDNKNHQNNVTDICQNNI